MFNANACTSVNDVKNLYQFITRTYGFQRSEIRVSQFGVGIYLPVAVVGLAELGLKMRKDWQLDPRLL